LPINPVAPVTMTFMIAFFLYAQLFILKTITGFK
jgi:hypothetical protein